MSGTSMDAVDVAIVDIDNRVSIRSYAELPIPDDLRQHVRNINGNTCISDLAKIDNELGHLFADSINQVIESSNILRKNITAIGSHGQTVFHQPDEYKNSIQIGNPNIICAKTGITTVADFRRMDMAFDGQGAPLAPAFHRFQFQDQNKNRAILNIGGIANITLLPNHSGKNIIGFDTGPGNGLLDDWNFQHNHTVMDKDSQWAKQGEFNQDLLSLFLSDQYFSMPFPKSTGRDYFNLEWLLKNLQDFHEVKSADVQATLLELTVKSIVNSIKEHYSECEELFLCGGGANNSAIVDKLIELLPQTRIESTTKLGIPPDAVEAITFAWLAYCRINYIKLDLSTITGSKEMSLLGAIYS